MKNTTLPFPGFAARLCLFLTIICLSVQSNAQVFLHDWAAYQRGPGVGRELKLAVNPVNGDSYVLEVRFAGGAEPNYWNIIKYDNLGRLVWTLRYVEGSLGQVFPMSLAFKNGAVFVLGEVGITPREPWMQNGAAVVKIIDGGTSGIQSWTRPFVFTAAGHCFSKIIVPDPAGSGVIFTGIGTDVTPGRDQMRTIKINGETGSAIWNRPYDMGYGTGSSSGIGPNMVATDPAGNVYVTGMTRDLPISPSAASPGSLFVIKYNSTGVFQWINKITAPDFTNEGYDIAVDGTGVYVLGEKRYLDGTRDDGFNTLTKWNLSGSPEPLWHQERPGEITSENQRRAIALDPASSSIYIAYDGETDNVVKLDKFDTGGSGLMRWSREITGTDEYITARALSLDRRGRLIIGTNLDFSATSYRLYAYNAEGNYLDAATVADRQIRNMIIDNDNRLHIMGNRENPAYPLSKFVAQYTLTEPAPPIPDLARGFERVEVDLYRLRYEECWTNLRIAWRCFMPPFCNDPLMQSVMTYNGQVVWETKFTKPLDAQLPRSKDFRTFSLRMMDANVYKELIRIDDKLAKAGVTEIHLVTDSKDLSLSLDLKTTGVSVPVTVSFLNKKGIVIGESQFTAPFQKIMTDTFSEPVGSISLGIGQQMAMSYYPNPSSGEFKVTLDKTTKLPAEVSVYDMAGFKIYQGVMSAHEATVALDKVKEGLYILQVKSDQGESRGLIQVK
ncbi:MAG: T9SS type A sorting domain-containing protein [Chryseolinea sp.]